MANVIDELVLELGLDPAKFNKGQKDALDAFKKTQDQATRVGKEIEASSAKVVEFFSTLKTQAVSLAATFVEAVGVKDFIQNITGAGVALGRTAKFTGESVKELSEWRNVAEKAGGSADVMSATLLSLTQQIQNVTLFGAGDSPLVKFLYALHISLNDVNGKAKTAGQLLREIADSSVLKGRDPRQQAAFLQAAGLDPVTTQLIIENSRKQLEAKLRLAGANAFTDPDVALAQQFTDQFEDVSQAATRVGQNIFIIMAPALKVALGLIQDFVDFLKSNQYIAIGFFLALSGVISSSLIRGALTPLLFTFRALSALLRGQVFLDLALLTGKFIPALGDAFLALGAKIEASQLGRILGALALVIAAAEAYQWVNKKLNSAVGIKEPSFGDVVKSWQDYASGKRPSTFSSGGGDLTSFSESGGTTRPPGSVPSLGANPKASAEAWQAALASEKKYGIPAAVTFAQWRLESANGTRVPFGSNNPFGIKAVAGQPSVSAVTTEYVGGQRISTTANFAKYASIAEAFDAHARLLATSPRYAKARGYENNPAAFADALTGVYATDPGYGAKLKALIAGSRLASAGSTTNSRSTATTVHIGTIEVHNPKDASQVAANVRTELARNILVGHANNGAQ